MSDRSGVLDITPKLFQPTVFGETKRRSELEHVMCKEALGRILLLAVRIQCLCRLFPVRAIEASQRKGRDINAVDAANIDRPSRLDRGVGGKMDGHHNAGKNSVWPSLC